MKKKYKIALIIILFFIAGVTAFGLGLTNAYYRQTVTGAATGRTADYEGEVTIVSETHTVVPASTVAVDEVKFYVKNYSGSDSSPTNTSEVYLSYILSFTLPTWASGCAQPMSYKLFSVNESTNAETEVTLTNNATSDINFSMMSAEKDYYKLKVYWDITKNSVSCYAGKSGTYGISADIHQTQSVYGSL